MRPARAAALALLTLAACSGDVATSPTASPGTTGPLPATSSEPDPTSTSDTPSSSDPSTSDTPTSDPSVSTTDATTGIAETTGVDTTCAMVGSPFLRWSSAGELPGLVTAATATPTGDSVVVGRTLATENAQDAFLSVHSPDGDLRWTATYAGAHGLADGAIDVAVDAAGFVHVLVVETVSMTVVEEETIADRRLVILRHAPDGASLWRWEQAYPPQDPAMSHDVDGTLEVVGDTIVLVSGTGTAPRIRTVLDRFGDVLAVTSIAVPKEVELAKIWVSAIGSDGSVYVSGEFFAGQGEPTPWIGRFDGDGSLAWTATFGMANDRAEALLVDANGGIVTLWVREANPGEDQRWIRRHEPDGDVAWTWQFPFGAQLAGGLACDGTGLFGGGVEKPAGPQLQWDQRMDLGVWGLNTGGVPRWGQEHEFGPPYSYGAATVVAGAPDGDVIVAGSYIGDDGASHQPWLGRYSFE